MHSLAAIEFWLFIGLAVWLVYYQVTSTRRRRDAYEAERRQRERDEPRSSAQGPSIGDGAENTDRPRGP